VTFCDPLVLSVTGKEWTPLSAAVNVYRAGSAVQPFAIGSTPARRPARRVPGRDRSAWTGALRVDGEVRCESRGPDEHGRHAGSSGDGKRQLGPADVREPTAEQRADRRRGDDRVGVEADHAPAKMVGRR